MFRPNRSQDDFNAEIEAHVQIEAARLRESGLSEREAAAAARRAFGNTTIARERFYEGGRWLWRDHLTQDLHVLGFTSAVTLLAGILFGLAPALSGARTEPSHSLKEAGTRTSSGSTSLAVRHILVGGQMALAVMMLISAGLLLRSFLNVVRLDPGFQTAHVITVTRRAREIGTRTWPWARALATSC